MLLKGVLVRTHELNYKRRILILKVKSLLLIYPFHLLDVTLARVVKSLSFFADEAKILPFQLIHATCLDLCILYRYQLLLG